MRTIYLDHNAGTPLLPEVVDAMRAADPLGLSTSIDEIDRAAAALARAWEGLARPDAHDQGP